MKNVENLANWDKLPNFILGNFGIAQVKIGQVKTFENSRV